VHRLHRGLIPLLLLLSCGPTINQNRLNAPPRPMTPRQPLAVEMFTTRVPDRPYVEVAMIETQQGALSPETPSEIFDILRERAAEMGCDGVVLLGANDAVVSDSTTITNESPGVRLPGQIYTPPSTTSSSTTTSTRTLHGYRGTCIMWRDADVTKEPAASPPPPPDPRCDPPCEPGFKCWGGVCAVAH
jgi:hypothetical protein